MTVKAGVWIDHKQAILVRVTNAGSEVSKIASDLEKTTPPKTPHSKKPKNQVPEDTVERKRANHLKTFYDEVIAALHGSEALLILGPGEAKGEFHKRLKSKKLNGLAVEVETVDKMTDRQLAAKVVKHFAEAFTLANAAPKKPAPKKSTLTKPALKSAAKTKAAKPVKKSGQ